ncbi:MAG: DUF4406 domain-containing protein [bacterium]
MKKVYIASPYTYGDVGENVKRQIDAAETLISEGYAPYVPIYYHFQHIAHPHGYETWMKLCFEWVKTCDALVRLEGLSKGADREVELAKENNIPVFYSLYEFMEHEYLNR